MRLILNGSRRAETDGLAYLRDSGDHLPENLDSWGRLYGLQKFSREKSTNRSHVYLQVRPVKAYDQAQSQIGTEAHSKPG
jgi:hypothetical protein